MALISHSGAGQIDIGGPGIKRDDISELLAASLVMSNQTAGLIQVGPEFVDSILKYNEDKLNPDTVTDTTAGGITAGGTTLTLSLADAAVLDLGYKLVDISASLGGIGGGEVMQVTAISGQTVTIARGQDGTTAVAHAQSAVYSIVSRPTIENSDLGKDISRNRVTKYNYIHRHELNVNLSSEVIVRSRRGYTPGVNDELNYQFFQRLQELLRIWNKSLIYSKPNPGTNGSVGVSAGDYSTMAGIRSWLDGTQNTTAAPINYSTLGLAAGQVDRAINSANKTLFRQGAYPDWALGGPNIAEDVGLLYSDRIRIQQDDFTRGYAATFFRTTLTNELRMLMDGYVYDTSPAAEIYILDSARWRIRPAAEQFLFVVTAPNFRDGDSVRALSKLSVEARNTGTDVGYASVAITNVSP